MIRWHAGLARYALHRADCDQLVKNRVHPLFEHTFREHSKQLLGNTRFSVLVSRRPASVVILPCSSKSSLPSGYVSTKRLIISLALAKVRFSFGVTIYLRLTKNLFLLFLEA